jgi:hypothetical protein
VPEGIAEPSPFVVEIKVPKDIAEPLVPEPDSFVVEIRVPLAPETSRFVVEIRVPEDTAQPLVFEPCNEKVHNQMTYFKTAYYLVTVEVP